MRRFIAVCLLAAIPAVGHAQAPSMDLTTCLADQSSGRDRKDLARWVFLAMAAHPENKEFLAPGVTAAIDRSNRTAAGLFMRLMTESCSAQMKVAVSQGGPKAVEAAFSALGQLAMRELMTNPDVNAAMGSLQEHMDGAKLAQVLGGQ
jgi:hypothetical protein